MFKSYDNILVLSGVGFGIDAGFQITMICIEWRMKLDYIMFNVYIK